MTLVEGLKPWLANHRLPQPADFVDVGLPRLETPGQLHDTCD